MHFFVFRVSFYRGGTIAVPAAASTLQDRFLFFSGRFLLRRPMVCIDHVDQDLQRFLDFRPAGRLGEVDAAKSFTIYYRIHIEIVNPGYDYCHKRPETKCIITKKRIGNIGKQSLAVYLALFGYPFQRLPVFRKLSC